MPDISITVTIRAEPTDLAALLGAIAGTALANRLLEAGE